MYFVFFENFHAHLSQAQKKNLREKIQEMVIGRMFFFINFELKTSLVFRWMRKFLFKNGYLNKFAKLKKVVSNWVDIKTKTALKIFRQFFWRVLVSKIASIINSRQPFVVKKIFA